MQDILIGAGVLAAVGLVVGLALVFTGRRFFVETDEREEAVRGVLPGNNCGACGFAGCDAVAAAVAKGEAPVNVCPVGGQPVADKIGEIMGVEAGTAGKNVAVVKCRGNCDIVKTKVTYTGIRDCASGALTGIALRDCDSGCLGFGTCAAVCPQNAISVRKGVAVVDEKKCVGCGLCAKACPKKLIAVVPLEKGARVLCSNPDKGLTVKKICSAGCIGCGLCEKNCPSGAVSMNGSLPVFDPEKCSACGLCRDKCPVGAIALPE